MGRGIHGFHLDLTAFVRRGHLQVAQATMRWHWHHSALTAGDGVICGAPASDESTVPPCSDLSIYVHSAISIFRDHRWQSRMTAPRSPRRGDRAPARAELRARGGGQPGGPAATGARRTDEGGATASLTYFSPHPLWYLSRIPIIFTIDVMSGSECVTVCAE
jgi:hypothetical protein